MLFHWGHNRYHFENLPDKNEYESNYAKLKTNKKFPIINSIIHGNYRKTIQRLLIILYMPIVKSGITKINKTPQLKLPYPLAIRLISPKVEIPKPNKRRTVATTGLSRRGNSFPIV